ncbi:MAG: LuxR C-terminal-related transcriptional regulator [Gemmatimonadota bacterium]|nr:LuxR C-terminal-related transcriptional regulator [Gemmatimonadota bacterium]
MSQRDYDDSPRILLILSVVFLLIVVGGVVDLILDRPTTLLSWHVGFEVMLVVLSLSAAGYLGRGWYRSQALLARSSLETERLARERAAWERDSAALLRGLGSAVSSQFELWSLTSAERRVALQLLKGFSHKRIARETKTSERTARQHSVAVYRKSGLAGRAELAGFFLEPLLLPEDVGDGRSA